MELIKLTIIYIAQIYQFYNRIIISLLKCFFYFKLGNIICILL